MPFIRSYKSKIVTNVNERFILCYQVSAIYLDLFMIIVCRMKVI